MDWNNMTGTCTGMCPKSEISTREKEGLLHKFEMVKGTENQKRPKADPNKIIKCYMRSAAGQTVNNPSDVRPFPILVKTINYLFQEIFPMHQQKPIMVYNFMFDRLRSIRQDMVVQNLNPGQCIVILEPVVKFHTYFGYVLLNEDLNDYDPHINNTHLHECLKRLLYCYDVISNVKIDVNDLNLKEILKNHCEMESIYILLNLGDFFAMSRGVNLNTPDETNILKNSLILSISWCLKNYARVFSCIKKLPALMLCVIAGHIPRIRRHALLAMSTAYSINNCEYPVSQIKDLLLYDNDTEVIEDCNYFSIKVNGMHVNFNKKNFNLSVQERKPRKLNFIDFKLANFNLGDISIQNGQS